MATLALLTYAVFAAVAFGGRSVIQYRRTGSTGFRGFSGRAGSLEWFAGRGFTIAMIAALLAPILDLLGWLPRIAPLDASTTAWIGLGAAVAGGAIVVWSQLSMGDSWRIGVDDEESTPLVTGGIFALVRNPIFSGMMVVFAGLALMVPNVLALAALVALILSIEAQVRLVEEPYLLRSRIRVSDIRGDDRPFRAVRRTAARWVGLPAFGGCIVAPRGGVS